MIKKIISNLKDVLNNTRSFKQIIIQVLSKFIKNKNYNDDFNWNFYTNFYSEELRLGEKFFTLILTTGDYKLLNGELKKINPIIKPLHPNHKLLYETILNLNENNIAEIGCGGGDHLYNLFILKNIKCVGYDRSKKQLDFLRDRHSKINFRLDLNDITNGQLKNKHNVIYTQAVLMHISEKFNRFENAVKNILNSSLKIIVLMENWTRHDYVGCFKKMSKKNSRWGKIYFYMIKDKCSDSKILIISNSALSNKKLIPVSKNPEKITNINNK